LMMLMLSLFFFWKAASGRRSEETKGSL
jgi:hypothetical protein